MSVRRAGILGAALVLEHVPDLVRYGSKPSRELDRLPELERSLRTYEQALAYPPHQVFIGNARPEAALGAGATVVEGQRQRRASRQLR